MSTLRRLRLLCEMSFVVMAAMTRAEADPEKRYIVSYPSEKAARTGRAAMLRLERELPAQNAVAVRLTAAEAARLASDPDVLLVEPDPRRYRVTVARARPSSTDIRPAATSGSTQVIPYGISAVKAVGLVGVPNAGIKVCVIDSGYDLGHEDKPAKPIVSGQDDPAGAGLWTRDPSGHGTHVSGTINARNNTTGVVGVFPRAPMHIIKVFNANDDWIYSSDLIAALDRCMAAGAQVVNMSLGGADESTVEREAFGRARESGVITVAAAGNDATSTFSYPASYPSVISVAAIDENLQRAGFSNFNSQVLLSAPGVSVLSTLPRGSTVKVDLTTLLGTQSAVPMDNFPVPTAPVSARLVNCGLAGSPLDCVPGAAGAICLIERGGDIFFSTKAQSCEAAGGIGAVVFNKVGETGPVYGTLGETRVGIPVVGIDRTTGLSLRKSYLGTTATLNFSNWPYGYLSGTSMATPHVAGVAALVWSRHPRCTSETIRKALIFTAQDLGLPGRDPDYGVGLVRARPASAWLARQPCGSAP